VRDLFDSLGKSHNLESIIYYIYSEKQEMIAAEQVQKMPTLKQFQVVLKNKSSQS
jgi:hypothetical protein